MDGDNCQHVGGLTHSLKQQLRKSSQQQGDKFDISGVSNACHLMRYLIRINDFRKKRLLTPFAEKEAENLLNSRVDHLLRFAHFIFSSVDSSLEGDFYSTTGLSSKGMKLIICSVLLL